MAYPQDIFELALGKLTGAARLVECLLWRGFFAELKEGRVWLHQVSHDDDITMLQQCGLECRIINDPECIYLAEIQPAVNESVLRTIFFSNGMCLAGRAGGSFINAYDSAENFESFKGMDAAKMPTRLLDPGVALLVKSLFFCGVSTMMSCGGGVGCARKMPTIWASSRWDSLWLQYILKRSWITHEESRMTAYQILSTSAESFRAMLDDTFFCKAYYFSFPEESRTRSKSDYEFCWLGRMSDDNFGQFVCLQKLARTMMKMALSKEFLTKKQQLGNELFLHYLTDEDYLKNTWCQMVLQRHGMEVSPSAIKQLLGTIAMLHG
jgi:hypothetical protein